MPAIVIGSQQIVIDFLYLEMQEDMHETHDTAFVTHMTANKELRHPYTWYNQLKYNCHAFFKKR